MSEEHSASRRASLKKMGAMGAAVVLGGSARVRADSKPAGVTQAEPPVNVPDLAVSRMLKGHS